MGESLWAGLDLGEAETRVCVVGDDGASVFEATCASSAEAIDDCLGPYRDRIGTLGVEAGSMVQLMRDLQARAYPVVAFDARQTKQFIRIRRNKTDAIDARGIADVARLGHGVISQVLIKSVPVQQLRTQLSLRNNLVRQRLSTEALIQGYICLYGGARPKVGSRANFAQSALKEIERVRVRNGISIEAEVAPLVDLWERMTAHLKRLDRKLADIAKEHETCRRLMGIPGVGPMTALSFFSAIEDPHRFTRISEVGSYLGLAPRMLQSGNRSRTVGISKMGDQRTRTFLVIAATSILRGSTRETELKRWGLALRGRAGARIARTAVARKLAVIMLSIWRSGSEYQPWPQGEATSSD